MVARKQMEGLNDFRECEDWRRDKKMCVFLDR